MNHSKPDPEIETLAPIALDAVAGGHHRQRSQTIINNYAPAPAQATVQASGTSVDVNVGW